jgi:hypothetical protein
MNGIFKHINENSGLYEKLKFLGYLSYCKLLKKGLFSLPYFLSWYEGGLISLWLYKENNKLRD